MSEAKIVISGLVKHEVEKGLPHLLEEFGHRPWILNPRAYWDEPTNKLIISVEYDLDDSDVENVAKDEIWDCVIATMNFQNEIHFVVLKE